MSAACAGSHTAVHTQGLNPLWALLHFVTLVLSALVGVTGMIVALVRFGNTITGLVMSTHQVLGLLSVGEQGVGRRRHGCTCLRVCCSNFKLVVCDVTA